MGNTGDGGSEDNNTESWDIDKNQQFDAVSWLTKAKRGKR